MKKKLIEFPWEIVIIIVFMAMSVTACSRYTINFDEFYTMNWCRADWHEFFYEVLHDTSPFLYYYMVRPFAILTGQNIFMARLFSLAAMVILCLVGIFFVKKYYGRKAAVFYLAIICFNPFMLQKSTEIRMYVWASAFTLLAGAYCYKLLVSATRKNWIFFTLFSLMGACTHYYVVLSLVFLYLGLFAWYAFCHKKEEMKSWLICGLVTVAVYLPFLVIAIFQIRESSGNWIPDPGSRLAPLKELFYTGINGTEILYLLVMAVFTLMSVIVFLRTRKAEYYWSVICCSAIWGITAFGIVFGELVKPIMLSRYLIMPVCLLFLGMCPVVKYINKYLVLALCFAFALASGIQYQSCVETLAKDHTVDMLQFARENIMENDKIVLVSGDDYLYNCTYYYIPQSDIYYTGDFQPEKLVNEEKMNEFWFFDSGEYMDPQEIAQAGLRAENYGHYQLGYIHFEVYKVKPLP